MCAFHPRSNARLTGSFIASSTNGIRSGVRKEVDVITDRLQEHDEAIARIDAVIARNAGVADEAIRAAQASLKASIASLRDELLRKLHAVTAEMAQLQKQVRGGVWLDTRANM
jgi:hypothetical protein